MLGWPNAYSTPGHVRTKMASQSMDYGYSSYVSNHHHDSWLNLPWLAPLQVATQFTDITNLDIEVMPYLEDT